MKLHFTFHFLKSYQLVDHSPSFRLLIYLYIFIYLK